MSGAVWIWYPGDFELYHGMRQNFRREERGFSWPAFWKMDDWRKNIRFFRKYSFTESVSFTVHGYGIGHVKVGDAKFPLEKEIFLPAGEYLIEVFIGNMTGFPCIYVEGGDRTGADSSELTDSERSARNSIRSDASWGVDDFLTAVPVGTSSLFTHREQNPGEVEYEEIIVQPKSVIEKADGTLIDFGRMVDGWPVIECKRTEDRKEGHGCDTRRFSVVYGESKDEALDPVHCYYKDENAAFGLKLRKRAFRYLFLPELMPSETEVYAVHQRFPLKERADFSCDDTLINRIWDVAAETYGLCSGLFFIDGIKRDRWIWSGDAYQSMMVNPYLYSDKEIDKRTSRALRGNTGISQHINTIVDYSMLWLISIENEYMMDGDIRYVREMYPKMEAMMDLLKSQTDEHGFVYGRERDWIYIDWADIDKDGCISAEQVLMWKCCKVMSGCARLLAGQKGERNRKPAGLRTRGLGPDGRPLPADTVVSYEAPPTEEEREQLIRRAAYYEEHADKLKKAIDECYWDEEKGALIDSFTSGKRNVTRHANIFAVLFDFADDTQREQILRNVLYNTDVPAITTPYFKFFELDTFGKLGDLERIWGELHSYWGGMIERGAVTFWETFDPKEEGGAQYSMYGDPFGKSLCHAWGASPIYLLGRYFLGVKPTSPGYAAYEVKPRTEYFDTLDCVVPVGEKAVHIVWRDGQLKVTEE